MAIALIPETIIEQGRHWTIATNLNQNLIGRLVVVLVRDQESVTEVSPAEWMSLHHAICRTRGALDALFRPDQVNYAFLMNQDAQVHLHVVPRYRTPREWLGEWFEDAHYGELFGHEQRILSTDRLGRLAEDVRRSLPGEQDG